MAKPTARSGSEGARRINRSSMSSRVSTALLVLVLVTLVASLSSAWAMGSAAAAEPFPLRSSLHLPRADPTAAAVPAAAARATEATQLNGNNGLTRLQQQQQQQEGVEQLRAAAAAVANWKQTASPQKADKSTSLSTRASTRSLARAHGRNRTATRSASPALQLAKSNTWGLSSADMAEAVRSITQIKLRLISTPSCITFLTRLTQLYEIMRPEMDITVVPIATSAAAVALLEQGGADLAISSLVPTAKDIARAPDLLHIPLWTYAYVAVTNVPEVGELPLVFDVPQLCRIFRGNITHWNHPDLLVRNPKLAAARAPIEVVLMNSGLSYILDFTSVCGWLDPAFGSLIAPLSLPKWPRNLYNRSRVEMDTASAVSYVMETPYTISIVLSSYARKLGGNRASLVNPAGSVVRPSYQSVDSAVRALSLTATRNSKGKLEYEFSNKLSSGPGVASWPLNAAAMLALPRTFHRTTCRAQSELIKFLRWILDDSTVRYTIGEQEAAVLLPEEVGHQMQVRASLDAVQCGPARVNVDDAFSIMSGGGSVATTHTRARTILMKHYQLKDESHVSVTNILQSPETALTDMLDPLLQLDVVFFFPQAFRYIWPGNLEEHIDAHRIRFMPWAAHGVIPSYSFSAGTLAALAAAEALPLKLDMEALAGVFTGAIRSWTDPALVGFNPALASVFSGAPTAESSITLVLYGVGDRDKVGQSALSNALVLSLNKTRAVAESGLPWSQPADWRPVTARLDALGVRYVMVSDEIELEAAVLRIPGAVGYKLAFSNESNPSTDFAIVRHVDPRLEAAANATAAELQPYDVTVLGVPASFAACGAAAKPTSGGDFDMQTVGWSAAPSAAHCWPLTLLVTIALPADLQTAAVFGSEDGPQSVSGSRSAQSQERLCAAQARVAKYVEFVLFDELSGAEARSGFVALSSIPWMRSMIREELNGVWCGGQPLLYTAPLVWSLSGWVRSFASVVCGIFIISCAIAAALLFKFRSRTIIRAADLPLQLSILAGLVMLLVCPLLFVFEPNTSVCRLLGWMLCVGFSLAFGPIAAKIWRVHATFSRQKSLKNKRIPASRLYAVVAALVVVDVVLLGVQNIESPLLVPRLETLLKHNRVNEYTQCSVAPLALPIAATLFGIKAATLLVTSVLAFGVRHVSSAYGESANLSWAVWNAAFSSAILAIILVLVGEGKGDVHVFLLVFLVLWVAGSTLIFSFFYKFLALLTEEWRISSEASRLSRTSRTSKQPSHTSGTGTGTGSWVSSGNSALQMPSLDGVTLAVLEKYLTALETQLFMAKERRRAQYGTDDNNDAAKSAIFASRNRQQQQQQSCENETTSSEVAALASCCPGGATPDPYHLSPPSRLPQQQKQQQQQQQQPMHAHHESSSNSSLFVTQGYGDGLVNSHGRGRSPEPLSPLAHFSGRASPTNMASFALHGHRFHVTAAADHDNSLLQPHSAPHSARSLHQHPTCGRESPQMARPPLRIHQSYGGHHDPFIRARSPSPPPPAASSMQQQFRRLSSGGSNSEALALALGGTGGFPRSPLQLHPSRTSPQRQSVSPQPHSHLHIAAAGHPPAHPRSLSPNYGGLRAPSPQPS